MPGMEYSRINEAAKILRQGNNALLFCLAVKLSNENQLGGLLMECLMALREAKGPGRFFYMRAYRMSLNGFADEMKQLHSMTEFTLKVEFDHIYRIQKGLGICSAKFNIEGPDDAKGLNKAPIYPSVGS